MTNFKKCKDGSYFHNCSIIRREDDPTDFLFYMDQDKTITAHLNGYAIVPLEKYCKLIGEPFNSSDMIKEFDESLKRTANK